MSASYIIVRTDKIFKISPNDWHVQKDFNISVSMYFSTWENHVYANFLENIVPVSLDRHGNTSKNCDIDTMAHTYTARERVGLVILFVVLEVSDLVFDWEFFAELSNSDRYKEAHLRWAVLAFALWGTVNFVLALCALVYSVRRRERYKWEDLVDISATWFEDVPQMIMAAIVAVEEGEPITHWVQYTKAILAIVEALLRCIIILVTCCPRLCKKMPQRRRLRYRGLL